MKIIFLNTWWGALEKELSSFIEKYHNETDVFCFQEANSKVEEIGKSILKNYARITYKKEVNRYIKFALATYIKNSYKNIKNKVLLEDSGNVGLGIHTEIALNGKVINIVNMHGAIFPGSKKDTKYRKEQSKEIINYCANLKGGVIVGGDFNLDISTKSVSMFEENGYRNLIKDFGIKNTRNKYAWDIYINSKQHFADFTFVNNRVEVDNFIVDEVEVSDHLPMILKINF